MQKHITVAVDHQPPGQGDRLQSLICHGIADHAFVFFRRLYRTGFFQVSSGRVFLRSCQFFHQQRIQSHANLSAYKKYRTYCYSR